MKTVCIFPITGYESKISEITEKFCSEIAPELIKLGAEGLEIKFPEIMYRFVPNKKNMGREK